MAAPQLREVDVLQDVMLHLRSTNPAVYNRLRELFHQRREARRLQAESTPDSMQGTRLLARCTELSSIIQELFPER